MQALGDPARGGTTSNPYTRLLVDSLPTDRVQTIYFGWRRAFSAKFDVFHVHWPELLFKHRWPIVRWAKCVLFAAFIMRLRLSRTAIVRTVHNLSPHDSVGRFEGAAIRFLDRNTTLRIVMNEATPVPDDQATVLIPHGHYRTWYTEPGANSSVPGRLLTFGLIRAYKGIDDLVAAFRSSLDEAISLTIAGRADAEATAQRVRYLAGNDSRIELRMEFLPDSELEAEISAASLVVLPYREIHNSGVALLALSLNRPILVRESPSTMLLRDEFGPAWVRLFAGDLTSDVLEQALRDTDGLAAASRVDMESRDWARLATLLVAAYEEALTRVRRR